MRNYLLLSISTATILLASCAQSTEIFTENDDQLLVVASTSILANIATNVAGDAARVESLLPVGADPHSFQLSANSARLLADADLIFEHGAGLEQPLSEILNQSSQSKRIDLSQHVILVDLEGIPDPHIWLDPSNVQIYANVMAQSLAEIDPDNAEIYAHNAETHAAELASLDSWIAQQIASIPADKRRLVTNHDSLGYYARRYGLEIIGVVLPGGSTLNEPSAGALAELSDTIRQSGVSAIFVDISSSSTIARQLADEADVTIVAELYTGSLGPPGSDAETYIDMMHSNTQVIVEALGGTISNP